MFRVAIHEYAQRLQRASEIDMTRIVLAGAGTSGHVEPALAVANWLRAHSSDLEFLFLGTAEGVEVNLVPAASYELRLIDKAPFPRKLNLGLLRWPALFRKTLKQTEAAIRGADLVIGFGGYVAAPAYLTARRLGIPMIAHEANAKMGLANRLARRCGAIVLRAFGPADADRVGIPLRSSIVELARMDGTQRAAAKQRALKELKLDPAAPTILIFGGSLGSVKFNETVAAARKEITSTGAQIIHAVGAKNELPQAQAGYLPLHYIDDMAAVYAASDLVISRSGAVTVAETGVLGIYSLYIPLPIGNGEQIENAREVVSSGGGEILKNENFTSSWLTSNISRLLAAAQARHESGERIDFPLNASEAIGLRSLKVLAHE
jgi:UDP-N-acetylglucosamine--N-acetylmuramyl-(pentapeptide) pyrophosphoryl-undecaprenol N-acetylglucosamine transferase